MNSSNVWTTPDGVKFEVGKPLNSLKVKFKKLHKDATVPSYSKIGDAGLDLTAHWMINVNSSYIEYGTSIAVEIPEGYVGLIFPRSSVSNKQNFYLKNSVGVIDSGYRGEIKLRFNRDKEFYSAGDKIGQLIIIPYPTIYLEEVEELSNTERGEGGFGSTGI